jgi:hypothetical protein
MEPVKSFCCLLVQWSSLEVFALKHSCFKVQRRKRSLGLNKQTDMTCNRVLYHRSHIPPLIGIPLTLLLHTFHTFASDRGSDERVRILLN